jgi:hypothetical protein
METECKEGNGILQMKTVKTKAGSTLGKTKGRSKD